MLSVAALTVVAALALSLPALPPIGTAFEQAVSAEAVLVAATRIAAPGPPFTPPHLAQVPRSMVKVPQLGSCASSGRASRLWAAQHSQGEAGPLGAQPLPRVLELAASQAAYFLAPLTIQATPLRTGCPSEPPLRICGYAGSPPVNGCA